MSSPWKEVRHTDGRLYYFNPQTNQTQWTKPLEMMGSMERAIAGQPWREYKTPEGRKYWSHEQTKTSVWDEPEDFKAAVEEGKRQEASQRSQELIAAPQFVAGGTATFANSMFQNSNSNGDDYMNQDRVLAITDGSENVRPSAYSTEKNESQYSTYADAEAAFFKLLKRSNVGADWTWEQAMKATIREPQYKALKDPKDRKAAFEKYTADLRLQELEKSKDRLTKLRQDFAKMLKSHPEIKYYTRWKTARGILEGETIFKSASDDNERRSLFEEYVLELRKAHQEQEVVNRKNAMEDLTVLLKTLDLEPYTRWSEAQGIIQQSDQFKSETKFQALSKLDILNAFENHIKYLERTLNDKRQRDKQVKMRRERKNREAYIALLDQLEAQGEIRPGIKWKEIHPILRDDDRYVNMLGQPGSTPLDLFWDKVEEIDRDVRTKRSMVMDVLEEKRFQVTSKTTLEEFVAALRSDPKTSKLSQDMCAAVFDKIREKTTRRSDDDRHQTERQSRRKIDALRSAIKHLDPPVTLTDTWEQVRPRLLKHDEYKELDNDELRQSAFDKYVRRLKERNEEDREGERRERKTSRGLEKPERSDRERSKPLGREHESRHDPRERHRGDRERDRERDVRDRDRDRGRERDRERHARHGRSPVHRSPEPDAYEAERRRAAGERERQYQKGGGSFPTSRSERDRDRDRHDRDRDEFRERDSDRDRDARHAESVYERERREREAERERQFRGRDRDDNSTGSGKRRARPASPGDESDGSRRDVKRSRREKPTPSTKANGDGAPKKLAAEDEESEEGEITE